MIGVGAQKLDIFFRGKGADAMIKMDPNICKAIFLSDICNFLGLRLAERFGGLAEGHIEVIKGLNGVVERTRLGPGPVGEAGEGAAGLQKPQYLGVAYLRRDPVEGGGGKNEVKGALWQREGFKGGIFHRKIGVCTEFFPGGLGQLVTGLHGDEGAARLQDRAGGLARAGTHLQDPAFRREGEVGKNLLV